MSVKILTGDCRDILPSLDDESVHCIVTSPPYFGLRDYGVDGQMGVEATPAEFVNNLVLVFRELRRVLRKDGTVWLNLGDCYAGSGKGGNPPDSPHQKQASNEGSIVRGKRGAKRWGSGNIPSTDGLKPKDLIGIPWRVALALQDDGWWLRQDVIWSKPNAMPESVLDRCTRSHEYIFMFSKSAKYYYDAAAIAEDAIYSGLPEQCSGKRNKRSVWTVPVRGFSGAHFATFPPGLIEPCILACCPTGGVVLDPFGGAGTTGMVADRLGRNAIMIELNPDYAALAHDRIKDDAGMFAA